MLKRYWLTDYANEIVEKAITFLRGMNLENCYAIIDEVQKDFVL